MEENELITIIKKFESSVHLADSSLKNFYKVSVPVLLARRQGLIPINGVIDISAGVIDFKFHGQGCKVNFSGVIVDYDYDFEKCEYHYFDIYKLYDFYKSSSELSESFEKFHDIILKSEKAGLIAAINNSNTKYELKYLQHPHG